MNGYVQFETLEGEPIVINVDRLNSCGGFGGRGLLAP